LLSSVATAEEFVDTVRKQFPAQSGQSLAFVADCGTVEIKTANVSNVQLEVYRRVETSSKARAQQIFDDLAVSGANENGTVRINGGFKNGWVPQRGRDWDEGRVICISRTENGKDNVCLDYARELREMRYVITVPKKFNVNVETRAGHVRSDDVDGNLDITTRGGHVEAGNVTGKTHINTAGGHIKMGNAGSYAALRTAGGHIEVGDVGADLLAKTAGGHISVGNVKGSVIAKTAGGGIDIEQATGSIEATTSGGSVRARFAGQPAGDSKLETSGGSVRVELAGNLKLDVTASSSMGRIVSDYDLQGDHDAGRRSSSTYSAQLNGGGPKLTLRSSAGSIHINRYSARY
jgi:DUF4097 and DUF4098 domain-containing protein YvlB